jgi:hypothetical protein
MNRNPVLDRIERARRVAEIVHGVLSKREIIGEVSADELHVREKVILETTANKQRLSSAILDRMFPKEPSTSELMHYTSPEGLTGIGKSGELRLYALRKRIDEAEIATFAREHRLNGYIARDAGEPYYKELSDDLFYTSFTRPSLRNEAVMWDVFAKGGTGARLKVRLIPAAAELRSIQYQQPSRTLLNELNDTLAAADLPPFLPHTISKIGAFYLPSCLDVEGELRLLMKRHVGAELTTANDGTFEYLPVPINRPNPFCEIQVVGIELGPRADAAALGSAIAGTALAKVPISDP